MNRPDKIVVFKPLGRTELKKVLDIELGMVQQRIFDSSGPASFLFNATDEAKELLLDEGTDVKYGARPLKRAIERLLVHPMSNLIATEQITGGDVIRVDLDPTERMLTFLKESEGMSPFIMQQMTTASLNALAGAVGSSVAEDLPRGMNARSRGNK